MDLAWPLLAGSSTLRTMWWRNHLWRFCNSTSTGGSSRWPQRTGHLSPYGGGSPSSHWELRPIYTLQSTSKYLQCGYHARQGFGPGPKIQQPATAPTQLLFQVVLSSSPQALQGECKEPASRSGKRLGSNSAPERRAVSNWGRFCFPSTGSLLKVHSPSPESSIRIQ